MKRLFLFVMLSAVMLLSGCSATKVYRGFDASGAFVSSASPAVSVNPGEGFSAVSAGRTLCAVPVDSGMLNIVTTEIWYSLYKSDKAQLAVMLGECSAPCEWNISATGVEYQYKPLLYKFYGEMPSDATVLVYTRSVENDPWMPLFAQSGSAWEGETLVARYEWMSVSSRDKLVAEYREPALSLAEGMGYPVEDLNGFLKRSQKAFSLAGVQEGAQPVPAPHTNIPNALLAPVVGSVSLPEPQNLEYD